MTVYYVVVDQTWNRVTIYTRAQLGGDFDDYNIRQRVFKDTPINNASSVMVVSQETIDDLTGKMMEKKNANWLSGLLTLSPCNDLIEEYRKNRFRDKSGYYRERVLRAKVGSLSYAKDIALSLPTDEMKTLIAFSDQTKTFSFERDGNKVELPMRLRLDVKYTLKLLHDQEGLSNGKVFSVSQKSDNKVATESSAGSVLPNTSRHTLPSYDKIGLAVGESRHALDAAARSGSRLASFAIGELVGVPEVDILGTLDQVSTRRSILEKIQILLAGNQLTAISILYNEHTTLVEQSLLGLDYLPAKFPMLLRQRAESTEEFNSVPGV
ncbi:phage virion structural protein [Salmonella phage SPFM12]|nr:phage virion structural protein [Salmonella phage SPFM12]